MKKKPLSKTKPLRAKKVNLRGLTCLECGEIMVSRHRHDFVQCHCGNGAYIDGGQVDYVRIGGMDFSKMRFVEVIEGMLCSEMERVK